MSRNDLSVIYTRREKAYNRRTQRPVEARSPDWRHGPQFVGTQCSPDVDDDDGVSLAAAAAAGGRQRGRRVRPQGTSQGSRLSSKCAVAHS